MPGGQARNVVRKLAQAALRVPGITLPFSLLLRNRAVILMYHRFRVPELGVEGHDAAHVGRGLEYLRRNRYDIIPLEDLFQRLAEGRPVNRAVALTIDDGYLDQGPHAVEIFRRYDCPVTTFVTTGFLDGALWFWWDQIAYIFDQTQRDRLVVKLGDSERSYARAPEAGWQQAREDFTERCKEVPDQERIALLTSLSGAANVEVPAKPPLRYAPMTWDQARQCERLGMTFGPHTRTHPILSKTSDSQSAEEISDSWNQLRRNLAHPVPVFCYPNGRPQDFGSREIEMLRRCGIVGAVTGSAGYPETGSFRGNGEAPYRVCRFGYPPTVTDLVQIVGGIVRFREIARGAP